MYTNITTAEYASVHIRTHFVPTTCCTTRVLLLVVPSITGGFSGEKVVLTLSFALDFPMFVVFLFFFWLTVVVVVAVVVVRLTSAEEA